MIDSLDPTPSEFDDSCWTLRLSIMCTEESSIWIAPTFGGFKLLLCGFFFSLCCELQIRRRPSTISKKKKIKHECK